MAGPLSETVMLLMQVLMFHEEALESCLASGDVVGATWHASVVAQLQEAPEATMPIPDLPVSVRLPPSPTPFHPDTE